MAGAASPFLGFGQQNGSAGSAGRGRGGFPGLSTAPNQSKNANATRGSDPRLRGRGRGAPATRSGRGQGRGGMGRGAGPGSNTWRNKNSESQAGSVGAAASPFAPLKQAAAAPSPSSSPSPFGAPPQQQSPFAGFGKASTPFGAPSVGGGNGVGNNTAFKRQQQQPKSANGAIAPAIPVEDASLLGSYTERYEQLKIDRTKQREKAIREGQMADPNMPTSLNQAITPVGTCTSMCPEFERVERIVQKMVDKSEKFLHPTSNSLQNMEMKMLKRFRRSAAGYDEQLPSDIRTPKTLLQTMNYLIRHVINGPEPLGLIHKFVWDRTRSIRNDFSVQQVTQEDHVKIAVTCLERIARFHIVSLHLLSSPANEEPFDRHQEREQLNNTMLSLMYYYDDNRGRISFPNEDELRAYYIIFSIHDQRPDLEARVQKWPAELRNSPRVQIALELFAAASNTWEYQGTLDAKRPNAIAQGFYTRFFRMIDSPGVSYLMACVAEIYFNHMRQTAIRSIWKGYCRYPSSQQHKNEEWTVDELTQVLCFDNYEQTMKFCEEQDLAFAENANGDLYLNWGSRPVDSVAFQPSSDHSFSENHVESKRAGRTLAAVILGLNIKEAANLGMVDSSLLPERLPALPAPGLGSFSNDDSLFVTDDDNVASNVQMTETPLQEESPPNPSTSLPNPFAQFSQPATATSNPPPTFFSQPAAPAQPPAAASNPFASVFSSNSSAGSPTASMTTSSPFPSIFSSNGPASTPATPATASASSHPPAAASNPFSSIFTSNGQTSTPAAPATTPASSQPPATSSPFPSIFSSSGSASTPAAPATTSSPFSSSFPSKAPASTPTAPVTAPANPFANVTPPFGLSKSPEGQESSTPPPPASVPATQQPPSIFAPPPNHTPSKPGGKAPLFTPAPFRLPASPPSPATAAFYSFDSEPEQIKALTASESEPSILDNGKLPFLPETSNSMFGFSQQSTASGNAASLQPASFFSPEPTPKENEKVPIFSSLSPFGQSGNLSQGQDGVTKSEDPSTRVEKKAPPTEKVPLKSCLKKTSAFERPHIPLQDAVLNEPLDDTETPLQLSDFETEAPSVDEKPTSTSDADSRRTAWLSTLRDAAIKRRENTLASRKRGLEEPEPVPTEGAPKAAKVPKPAATPYKKSLAQASTKPLPKLPILEQIESMTARKPVEPKSEASKSVQVDEDELLLSAARIAAESLRSGPRLLDSWPTPYEPQSSSFSPGGSASSHFSFSRSQSPYSSYVNGYEVSLAPDSDLGLGRTLSRTEQRIRMTGAKGLAYKPLDFTSDKKRKSR